MIGRLRTAVLITIIAIAVWVYAEQESLTEARETARISFSVPDGLRNEIAVFPPDDYTGEVQLELRGAQVAVQSARVGLSELQRVSPEEAGLQGREDGNYALDMRSIVAQLDVIRDSGVEVVSARPATVTIEVMRLTQKDVPVVADLGDLDLEKPAEVAPNMVQVTMPERLSVRADDLEIRAVVDPEALADVLPGEQTERQARFVLPEVLRSRGVRRIPVQSAQVSFIVRQTTGQVELTSVVVALVMPPSELGAWRITLPESSAVVTARVRGPQEAIDRIRTNQTPVIGVIEAVPGDLREGQMQLDIAWLIRDGSRLRGLPAGVVVESEVTNVTVDVQRLDEAP